MIVPSGEEYGRRRECAKALSSQWADDPQSLFSASSRDLVCKAGF